MSASQERIRVLHLLNDISVGGNTSYLLTTAPRLERFGIESHVAYAEWPFNVPPSRFGRVRVTKYSSVPAGYRRPRNWVAIPRFVKLMRSYRPHVVHTYIGPACVYGWIAAALCRVPVAFTPVQSLESADYLYNLWRSVPVTARLAGLMIRRYIALCEYLAEEVKTIGRGVPGKVVVVNHGVDVDHYRPDLSAGRTLRGRLGLPEHAPVVGTCGRLSPEKHVEVLIRALPRIRAAIPDTRCLIVGDGQERAALQRLAEQLDVADVTLFAGAQSDVRDFYNVMSCHTFMMHGKLTGPLLGMANLEAMASGIPLITYAPSERDVRMAAALIDDGKNGHIAHTETEFADAVVRLLKNPDYARELGKQSRVSAERCWSIERHVEALAAIYLDLAFAGGGR